MYEDTKKQKAFKKLLWDRNITQEFKSMYYCGSKVVKAPGHIPGVFVFRNEEKAKFFGTTSCKSSWACPVCASREMAKYAAEISCALDALEEWEKQSAFMVTLTIPHDKFMTCAEAFEILRKTWYDFRMRGNKRLKRSLEKGWQDNDPFCNFCEELNCHHRVLVCEFTYGKAGWHPHFHALFWVDRKKFNEVAKWEEILLERWLEIAKKNTLKMWNKKFPEDLERNRRHIVRFYNHLNNVSKALYISKDKNGKVIRQRSSQYICGWGADRELTGNYRKKASHEGHYTPEQIFEKYQETGDEKWADLYIEYTRATKGKKRINYSVRSGIKDIIKKWKQCNAYKIFLQKKSIQDKEKCGIWRAVCWFNEKQWLQISTLDVSTENNIKQTILELAILPRGKLLIEEYLGSLGIFVAFNGQHPDEMYLTNLLNSTPTDKNLENIGA